MLNKESREYMHTNSREDRLGEMWSIAWAGSLEHQLASSFASEAMGNSEEGQGGGEWGSCSANSFPAGSSVLPLLQVTDPPTGLSLQR